MVDLQSIKRTFEFCSTVLNLEQVHSLCCMNEYLVIESSGYLCVNSLHALTAVWLDFPKKLRWRLIEQICQGVSGL